MEGTTSMKKKNRNIKGLQISQDAAKPGAITNGIAISPGQSLEAAPKGHRTRASGSTASSTSTPSLKSNSSSPSLPSSAFSSASSAARTGGGASSYHNKLSEQLANLEIGIEFKLDLRPEDLEIITELGSGNGGTVSKARHLPTGAIMARKVVHIDAKPTVRKQILRELQIMHDCNSPHIVSFYGAYLSDPHICMCMEYMDKGSLDNIYKKMRTIPVPVLGKIALAIVCGLTYLYDVHRIIHRDVKPSNVLVNSLGQIKICDFGVSGELINSIADTFVGTSTYMSPERIQGAAYTVRSDVWSLGITMIELCLGRFPFAPDVDSDSASEYDPSDDEPTLSPVKPMSRSKTLAAAEERRKNRPKKSASSKRSTNPGVSLVGGSSGMSILELLQHVVNEPAPTLPEGKFPTEVNSFINVCLEKDVDKRPTPKELLRHKWLMDSKVAEVDLEKWAKTLP